MIAEGMKIVAAGANPIQLIRGMEKHGGRLMLRSHVDSVLVEGALACGLCADHRHSRVWTLCWWEVRWRVYMQAQHT